MTKCQKARKNTERRFAEAMLSTPLNMILGTTQKPHDLLDSFKETLKTKFDGKKARNDLISYLSCRIRKTLFG